MNIFDSLKADHAILRALSASLLETHGDSATRDRVFTELKSTMWAHEKAEERFFYIPLLEADSTQEKARHSIAEHHELDEFVENLEEIQYSSSAWLKTATQMVDRLHHHLDEEEQDFFKLAGKVLSAAQKDLLAQEYRALMDAERLMPRRQQTLHHDAVTPSSSTK
ncbi:MAG: hypothetical protein RLZZ227_1977 [Pseudomonadota bacterium]|jgi:hypothetical protein